MTRLTDLLEHCRSRQTRAGEGKLFHGHETISPRPVRKMPEMIRFPPLANTARSPRPSTQQRILSKRKEIREEQAMKFQLFPLAFSARGHRSRMALFSKDTLFAHCVQTRHKSIRFDNYPFFPSFIR